MPRMLQQTLPYVPVSSLSCVDGTRHTYNGIAIFILPCDREASLNTNGYLVVNTSFSIFSSFRIRTGVVPRYNPPGAP